MTATRGSQAAAPVRRPEPVTRPAPHPARPGLWDGRPTRTPAPKPRLRVVHGAELRAWGRRRRARLITLSSLFLVALGLFGLVVSHVALTQGQFRLEKLQEQAGEQEARYERLRLEVARLESPERIVAAAQERLGMVPPPEVKYLSPTTAVPAKTNGRSSAAGQRSAGADGSADWSTVKRELAARP